MAGWKLVQHPCRNQFSRRVFVRRHQSDDPPKKWRLTMTEAVKRILIVLPLVPILAGCAVGYNTTVFSTKSNFGVNIESTPKPTAEISLSRLEGAITPALEGG